MVLRLIPQTILIIELLKLPEVLTELTGRPLGLILVTGPTDPVKKHHTRRENRLDQSQRNPPDPHA